MTFEELYAQEMRILAKRERRRPSFPSNRGPVTSEKRKQDRERMAAYIREHPGVSRAQLALALGMGKMLVKDLIGDLKGAGRIVTIERKYHSAEECEA